MFIQNISVEITDARFHVNVDCIIYIYIFLFLGSLLFIFKTLNLSVIVSLAR